MSTYDDLVNDYLRAVEQALAGVPANRRAELLADLSEHISAKRAELAPGEESEVEVRSILELLGDPEEVAAEARYDAPPMFPAGAAHPGPASPSRAAPHPGSSAAAMEIQPKRKSAALIWVILTIGMVATLCVAAGLLMVFFFAARGSGDGGDGKSAVPVSSSPAVTSSASAPNPAAS